MKEQKRARALEISEGDALKEKEGGCSHTYTGDLGVHPMECRNVEPGGSRRLKSSETRGVPGFIFQLR